MTKDYEVEEYSFQSFSVTKDDSGRSSVKGFQFQELKRNELGQANKEKVLKIERHYAKESGFKISPIVLEHRGLAKQESLEIEEKIQQEVERRLAEITEDARNSGIEEGRAIGREEMYQSLQAECEEKVAILSEMISDVLGSREKILKKQKREIFELVKNLTKWVVLKELEDDGTYLERLLEKLIQEIQVKSNLLIHVSREHFDSMPEVLDIVQKNLGILTNVRVEIDKNMNGKGLVVESDNGIVNASMEEQFKSLNKLFKDSDLTNEEKV